MPRIRPGQPRRDADPEWRRERARKAVAVRNSPASYINSLERANLTDEQKRRLIKLALSFLDSAEQPAGGAEAGDAA